MADGRDAGPDDHHTPRPWDVIPARWRTGLTIACFAAMFFVGELLTDPSSSEPSWESVPSDEITRAQQAVKAAAGHLRAGERAIYLLDVRIEDCGDQLTCWFGLALYQDGNQGTVRSWGSEFKYHVRCFKRGDVLALDWANYTGHSGRNLQRGDLRAIGDAHC
jgi:hypothetical protein